MLLVEHTSAIKRRSEKTAIMLTVFEHHLFDIVISGYGLNSARLLRMVMNSSRIKTGIRINDKLCWQITARLECCGHKRIIRQINGHDNLEIKRPDECKALNGADAHASRRGHLNSQPQLKLM